MIVYCVHTSEPFFHRILEMGRSIPASSASPDATTDLGDRNQFLGGTGALIPVDWGLVITTESFLRAFILFKPGCLDL